MLGRVPPISAPAITGGKAGLPSLSDTWADTTALRGGGYVVCHSRTDTVRLLVKSARGQEKAGSEDPSARAKNGPPADTPPPSAEPRKNQAAAEKQKVLYRKPPPPRIRNGVVGS
jgi:hypothetical protein